MKKILYLIDGSCYIFRYYFGIPMMYSPEGMPINILYGYCNLLQKLILSENSKILNQLLSTLFKIELENNVQYDKYAIIAFDSKKEQSFRKQIYSEYKAHRVEAPSELRIQCQHLKHVLDAFQIKSISVTSFEADDIIASYVNLAIKNDFDYVVILSCDKDMIQLISDKVFVYNTFKNILYDKIMVYDKFKIYPEQMVDYLTLIGDTADNIPGVPGIGPKTAIKLLDEYYNIDNIFNNIDNINSVKNKQSLLDNQEIICMSKKLIKLSKEVPLDKGINSLNIQSLDHDSIKKLYLQYGIKIKI